MLHVVDLVGSHTLSSGGPSLAGCAVDVGSDEAQLQQELRERRAANQELLGVSRMIAALAQAQSGGAAGTADDADVLAGTCTSASRSLGQPGSRISAQYAALLCPACCPVVWG